MGSTELWWEVGGVQTQPEPITRPGCGEGVERKSGFAQIRIVRPSLQPVLWLLESWVFPESS